MPAQHPSPPENEETKTEPGRSSAVDSDSAATALQHPMALERQGLLDQTARAADRALQSGGGRAAALQAAKIAILRERYEEAETHLRPLLQADPRDADVLYDLGLIAHRRGQYNEARSSYLATLRAREDYPDARYNLAILTWNRNVKDEARHHVARFVQRWPDDPRATELTALVR